LAFPGPDMLLRYSRHSTSFAASKISRNRLEPERGAWPHAKRLLIVT
jgi:hypothetical protein